MGLFDRFKKKNAEVSVAEEVAVVEEVPVTEPVAEEQEAPKVEPQEEVKEDKRPATEPVIKQNDPQVAEVANEGRRFTLLVENAKQLTEEEGIMIAGILYGKVNVGDEVYMLMPNHVMRMSKIDAIEISAGQNAETAENQRVVFQFKEIKDINQVPRYTVITSIRPQDKPSVNTTIENPHLLGLSMDYPRLNKDPLYMNILIYEICHAYYLVPARVSNNPIQSGDGTSAFKQDTQVRFPGIPDPADSSKSIFTIFTDWLAMANWKNLFDEKNPPKAIIMRFPDVVNVAKDSGVALNPFGPTSITLPADVIKKITSLEGYKQEFEGKE